jgi:hypothetical protein
MPNEKVPNVPFENVPLLTIRCSGGLVSCGLDFGWPPASSRRRRRRDRGVGTRMFGDEIGMGTQAVACAFDLHDDGVVEQSVEECSGDDRITEEVAPLGETPVRGQDHGALFVACVDQLEEEIGAIGGDGQIADLVDDQQGCAAVEADLLDQAALSFSPGQPLDQLGKGAAVDALARLDRGNTKGSGKMRFAGAGEDSDILPGIRDNSRLFTIRFIHAMANGWRSSGAIASVASPWWWSSSPTARSRMSRNG